MVLDKSDNARYSPSIKSPTSVLIFNFFDRMYPIFRSLLFRFDAEHAHHLAINTARFVQALSPSLVQPIYAFDHPSLHQTIWGKSFANPVGLAAGFDKNAQLVRFWGKAGFGFCEVGSVSARASQGNNKPRAFRLPADRAIINRMGLNNDGAEDISRRLKKLPREGVLPLGINIAKTHDPQIMGEGALLDFRHSFRLLASLADYIVLNISCPNTAEGKTFEDPGSLDELLGTVISDREDLGVHVPILVKLSPTFSQHVVFDSAIEEILAVVQQHGVQGLVATNTASDRQNLVTSVEEIERIGRGGLSGAPLTTRTTRLVNYLYEKTKGEVPYYCRRWNRFARNSICEHKSRCVVGSAVYRAGIQGARDSQTHKQRIGPSITSGWVSVDTRGCRDGC